MKIITVGKVASLDAAMRDALSSFGYEVVGEARDEDEAARLSDTLGADCVLVGASCFREEVERASEAERLRARIEALKLVNRAKALLMEQGLSEADAFARMQKASMNTRRPLRDIAEAVILDAEVRK